MKKIGIERRCKMSGLIICETDRGHFAVRPDDWAGMYKDGKIKESGLNHTAIFKNKEDAELFVKCKNKPTAYNVEEVVEELQEAKKDISNITTLGDCFKVGYRKGINEAIEIVKGGVK